MATVPGEKPDWLEFVEFARLQVGPGDTIAVRPTKALYLEPQQMVELAEQLREWFPDDRYPDLRVIVLAPGMDLAVIPPPAPEHDDEPQETHLLSVAITGALTPQNRPTYELKHPDSCGSNGAPLCPFGKTLQDQAPIPYGWPIEAGEYVGDYWSSKTWTDAGWEYDAGIEWTRRGDG